MPVGSFKNTMPYKPNNPDINGFMQGYWETKLINRL